MVYINNLFLMNEISKIIISFYYEYYYIMLAGHLLYLRWIDTRSSVDKRFCKHDKSRHLEGTGQMFSCAAFLRTHSVMRLLLSLLIMMMMRIYEIKLIFQGTLALYQVEYLKVAFYLKETIICMIFCL